MKKSPFNWIIIGLIAYLLIVTTDAGRGLPGGHWAQCTGPIIASTHTQAEQDAYCGK